MREVRASLLLKDGEPHENGCPTELANRSAVIPRNTFCVFARRRRIKDFASEYKILTRR